MSGSGFKALLPDSVRDAFSVLRASADAGRLAHAYIISCTKVELGISFSVLLMQWLYCREAQRPCGQCRSCRQIEARIHPDAVWIEPESKSRVIKIEQIREQLNPFIHQTSFEGGWKTGVILDADRLNENAANAFLKTLEEPPANCLLLLITDNPQRLMPTILSRCQQVRVGDTADAAAVSKIETAMLEWLRRRNDRTNSLTQSAWISAILGEIKTRAEKEESDAAIEGTDEDVIKGRIQSRVIEARLEILRILFKWERDLLVCTSHGDKKYLHFSADFDTLVRQSSGLTLTQCMARLDRVEHAIRLLEQNVPEASVWETVLPV